MHKGDKSLLWLVAGLLLMPILLAYFSHDRFRYPCQDPANWDKDFCKKPLCDVTRTCPEHVFKGGRDPRLGMPDEQNTIKSTPAPAGSVNQGVNCGK